MAQESTPARDMIGREERLAAIALVRDGRVFELGTEFANDMPKGPAETFPAFRLSPYRTPKALTRPDDPPPFDFSMEVVSGSQHLGSHIDAFSHIASYGKHFGDVLVQDSYDDFGWRAHGVESIPPLVGRGVLLDAARLTGGSRLPDGFEITPEQLEALLAEAGLRIRRGDIVLIRTGKFADYHGDGEAYFAAQPGVGLEAAVWLHEQGMAVLGTDTTATEPQPFRDLERTLHAEMLVRRGVHLLEILDLDALAEARAREFLFVCLPLRLRGATGSWVRPIAMT